METRDTWKYVRRRLLQVSALLLFGILYVWSGRMGAATPDAYLAALYDAAPDWQSDRAHCLVPEMYELQSWEGEPMSPSLLGTLEEAGWKMYEDTLPPDSSVILWRIHEARPAGVDERFTPVRFEPFSAYLSRFLPGTYHRIGVRWSMVLVGKRVSSATNLSLHVVRCWLGECHGLGIVSRVHFDGWGEDPEVYARGEVGHCDGTFPTPPEQGERWW